MTPLDLCYRKGFTDQDKLRDFQEHVGAGDTLSLNRCLESNARNQVDPGIFATKSNDLEIYRRFANGNDGAPIPGSDLFNEEAALVLRAASERDVPYADLDDMIYPVGMRTVPYFLRDLRVDSYEAGLDFMTNEGDLENILAGNAPTEALRMGDRNVPITNGRTAATFVHADDPLKPWLGAVIEMIGAGIPYRMSGDMEMINCDRFAGWGVPFFYGALGEAVRRGGLISFRRKWGEMVPRPEQYCPQVLGQICSQAYPEGSPMHPSQGAMHSFVALVQKDLLLNIFDGDAALPNGNTVESELELLADWIGFSRIWAGVHYVGDHDTARPYAKELAQKIARELLF